MAGLRGVVKIVVTIKLQLLRCVQGMSLMSCTALLWDVRFDMSHDRNRRDDLEYLKAHRFPVGSRIQKKTKKLFFFYELLFRAPPLPQHGSTQICWPESTRVSNCLLCL